MGGQEHVFSCGSCSLDCVEPCAPCAVIPLGLFWLANNYNLDWSVLHPVLLHAGFCNCSPFGIALDDDKFCVENIACKRGIFTSLENLDNKLPRHRLFLVFAYGPSCPYAIKDVHNKFLEILI